jgi:hypothetical protein
VPARRKLTDFQPPTKEHVTGLVEEIRTRLEADRCPDAVTLPSAPAAAMEWLIEHHQRARHHHRSETVDENMRDVLVIHAYVTSWLLLEAYDTGRGAGMRWDQFSDRDERWTHGHQVHIERHRTLAGWLTPEGPAHSAPPSARRRPSPEPVPAADAAELADAARAVLRERRGFDVPADCDFLVLSCEELEVQAAPPPGIAIDLGALRLAAACAVQDLADVRSQRVMAGEQPAAAGHSAAASAALARLKAALARTQRG